MKKYICLLLAILLILGAAPIAVSASAAENSEAGYIIGDADLDGDVTILDATAIQRYLAGLPNAEFSELAADADLDGRVTILDSTAIRRTLAGLAAEERDPYEGTRVKEALILVHTGAGEPDMIYSVRFDPETGKGKVSYTFTQDELSDADRLKAIELSSHFADVTDTLINEMNMAGMPKLTVEQKAQWYGELLLHFFGMYVKYNLDKTDLPDFGFKQYIDYVSDLLSCCVSAELDYNNGEILDSSHGVVSVVINKLSKKFGKLYYLNRLPVEYLPER